MTWRVSFVLATLAVACGGSPDGNPRSAMGGSGGSPPPLASVDQTCRDWCANKTQGASCHQGSFETVQPCYESCLETYQQEQDRECADPWIAIKDCQIGLECADLFGDCDSTEDAFSECVELANNRAFCLQNCPDVDLAQCEQEGVCDGSPTPGPVDELCDQVCGWPDDCFAQLGVNGSDCRQACEESVDSVGLACLQAIHDGVECLGTCDPEAITNEDVVRCEAAAQAIDSACE